MINSFSLFDFDIHNVYTNNIKKFCSWKFTCRTGKKEYEINWSKYKKKTVSHLLHKLWKEDRFSLKKISDIIW